MVIQREPLDEWETQKSGFVVISNGPMVLDTRSHGFSKGPVFVATHLHMSCTTYYFTPTTWQQENKKRPANQWPGFHYRAKKA